LLCELLKKEKLTEDVYDFTIFCPKMAEKTKPGQFLHILCGGDAYLRRPISVCEVVDKKALRFIFSVKGKGTTALAEKNVGDTIDVLGPLGNGFDIIDGNDRVLLVGGGIGIFPLLEVAKHLGKRANVILGFRSKENMMLIEDFEKYAENIFVATDDGSCGYKGLVTDLLKKIAESNKISQIYICGPTPMMRAASAVAGEFGIPAQASLEERMGCGIGACVTCACTVAGQRKRVCKDGPVFNASEVEWDG